MGGVGSGRAPEALQVGKAPERRGGPAPAFQRVGVLLVSGQCTGWACEAPPCLKRLVAGEPRWGAGSAEHSYFLETKPGLGSCIRG